MTWSLLARAEIDQTVTESPGRAWPNIITAARRDGLDLNDESLDDETSDARARLAAICSWLAELTPRQIEGIAVEWAPTNEVIFSLFEAPHDRPLNARVLSDGTLRLAALAVALLGENRRETFVIEEIENGVNPARVQLLLRLVETATRPRWWQAGDRHHPCARAPRFPIGVTEKVHASSRMGRRERDFGRHKPRGLARPRRGGRHVVTR